MTKKLLFFYLVNISAGLEKADQSCDIHSLHVILKESVGKEVAVLKVDRVKSGKIISCQKERLARWKDHFQILINPPIFWSWFYPPYPPKITILFLWFIWSDSKYSRWSSPENHKPLVKRTFVQKFANNGLGSLLNSSTAFLRESGWPILYQDIRKHQSSFLL